MEHGVLVDDGGLLQLPDGAAVLQVRVDERQRAGAMRLCQHALELDLAQAPLRAPLTQRLPHVADVGLTVAGPALRPGAGVMAHLLGETGEVGTADVERWGGRRGLDQPRACDRRGWPRASRRWWLAWAVEIAPQQGE